MSAEPDWEPPSEIAKGRSRRIIMVVVVGVLAVAGVAAAMVVIDKREEKKKDEAIAHAWSALSRCLIGEPLGQGEAASARFRAVQLAAMPLKKGEKSGGPEMDWPSRCSAPAMALDRALIDGLRAKKDSQDLAYHAVHVSKLLLSPDDVLSLDLSEPIDALYAAAGAEHVAMVPVAEQIAPPKPVKPLLTFEQLKAVKPLSKGAFSFNSIEREWHAQRDLTFLVQDKLVAGAPWMCTIAESGASTGATGASSAWCKNLPKPVLDVEAKLALLGARDPGAVPLVFAGERGGAGVFRSDTGERVSPSAGVKFAWGYARADGSAVTMGWKSGDDPNKLELAVTPRASSGGAGGGAGATSTMLKPPGRVANDNLYYAATLIPGWILWRGLGEAKDDFSVHLFAQALSSTTTSSTASGNDAVGPVIDVGVVSGWTAEGSDEQFVACSTKDATSVVITDDAGFHLATAKAGVWNKPIIFHGNGLLTCRGGEVTVTDATVGSVWQSRCSSGSCQDETVTLAASKRRAAVDMDGVIATVWSPSERGGLWLRVAPMTALAKVDDVLVIDDFVQGGKTVGKSWLYEFALYPVGAGAVLALSTTEGVYVVRVAADGGVAAMGVEGGF